MSIRKEEALKVELTTKEVESLHNPKFAGLLKLYEVFNKELNSLTQQQQAMKTEIEVMPNKLKDYRHTQQMKYDKSQREIQDLTKSKIQIIKLIKSSLKTTETPDIKKLHSIQIQPLVKFFDQLTGQITLLEQNILMTNQWLKLLEKTPEDNANEIKSTRETVNETNIKLLNLQLIRSNLYHFAMNYYESLSENQKNNLSNATAVYTEELSRNFIQLARTQYDSQKELMTLIETLPDSQNTTLNTEKILKRYQENTNILFKIDEVLKNVSMSQHNQN